MSDVLEAEGSPLLASGSTGQLVPHPLVKMLNEAGLLCDRLGAGDAQAQSRAAAGAVVSRSPAAKLRAVG